LTRCVLFGWQKLLCTYAFPQCQIRDGYPVGLPVCQEDCVAVRDLFCYNDWALIEDNKQRGVFFKSRGHFLLPECASLPSHKQPDLCSHAGLTTLRHDQVTSTTLFYPFKPRRFWFRSLFAALFPVYLKF